MDSTLGEQQRQRDRAAHPGQSQCGGAGLDVYLAGGFLLGAVPAGWLLARLGVIGWIKSATRLRRHCNETERWPQRDEPN
jgi:hypothetical protein